MMKVETIIKRLKYHSACDDIEFHRAVDCAIKLLEKQIPIKPKVKVNLKDLDLKICFCKCGNIVTDKNIYCGQCGQKLD